MCQYVCVCVYVCPPPEGINNQWCDLVRYRLCVIGYTGSTALEDIAVDKLEKRGLSNTARCACQTKMLKLTPY